MVEEKNYLGKITLILIIILLIVSFAEYENQSKHLSQSNFSDIKKSVNESNIKISIIEMGEIINFSSKDNLTCTSELMGDMVIVNCFSPIYYKRIIDDGVVDSNSNITIVGHTIWD